MRRSLPSPHGTRSTVTPHVGQSTRRIPQTKNTAMSERHELEPSRRKPVVSGPLLTAARADRPAVGPGLDLDLEFRLDQAVHESDPLGDERLVPLDTAENILEMHPAVAAAKGRTMQPHLYRTTPQDASFPPWPARQGGAVLLLGDTVYEVGEWPGRPRLPGPAAATAAHIARFSLANTSRLS